MQNQPQITSPFIDKHMRKISYLRISVTDRCNFTCMYCRKETSYIPHENILRFEEIERCIALFERQGIKKIRFTGGEPFVRKGFSDFLKRIREKHPKLELCLTTNGTFNPSSLQVLKEAKIAVNLSLDSFDKENFKKITGQDSFHQVMENVHALLDSQVKLKINAVAMKNINSNELESFINFAKNNTVDVRFIEFMPMGEVSHWHKELFWKADDILAQASKFATLIPISNSTEHAGPAKMFSIENAKGRFGIITPLSAHFCSTCNRLRLTSDGNLRTCLFDDKEHALKPLLRNKEMSDNDIVDFIQKATHSKQIGASILENSHNEIAKKNMVAIGG